MPSTVAVGNKNNGTKKKKKKHFAAEQKHWQFHN